MSLVHFLRNFDKFLISFFLIRVVTRHGLITLIFENFIAYIGILKVLEKFKGHYMFFLI